MLSTMLVTMSMWSMMAAAPNGPLAVTLGDKNQNAGLAVSNDGDGKNLAESLGGAACRRIAGEKSLYMYVKADEKLVPSGAYDAYVTVEYFDDRTSVIAVEYDKAPVNREKSSFYTRADDKLLAIGGNQWRRGIIHLPDARFGHGQNGGADFRLCCAGLAVRKIEVAFSRPTAYRPGGIDPTLLEHFRAKPGGGVELDIGCDATRGEAALLRAMGFTSVETYVTWQSVEDEGEGRWDWSRWDRQVEILEAAGLKWAPLLVAGPAYSLPKWYRESDRLVGYVCLEHHQESKIASLWNPAWRPWVDRFIKAFADRYRDRGVLELVRLGTTGTYGETLYPSGPVDGWTYLIPGPHHNHRGWWAGDRFAVASFRKRLCERYRDIAALNRAWNTQYADFDAVEPMLPEKTPSLRAKLDLINWYVDSMTEFGTFWTATARKYFPNTPVYQSLGGAGEPVLGADFSAQCKAFAPSHARVRVTNEASNYAANFAITREVVSGARAFGLDFGFEPASNVTADGNVARIYNATASGGIHLFAYKPNILQTQEAVAAFRQYVPFLKLRTPVVHAALYLPKTTWALDDASIQRTLAAASSLRSRVDFELLDRTTITSPLARRVAVLAIAEAAYAEPEEIENLRNWVASGGIIVARALPGQPLLRTPEGSDAPRNALLASPSPDIVAFRPSLHGSAPRRFVLQVGGPDDSRFLAGDWHPAESDGMFPNMRNAHMRWTWAKAGCFLPCDPASDATLTVVANLTSHSLPGVNRVLVNGVEVGRFNKAGVQTCHFNISKSQLAGHPVANVAFEVKTFQPSQHGGQDSRDLGLAVCSVEICANGAEHEPCGHASLTWEFDSSAAAACIRRIGKGATLTIPCQNTLELNEAVLLALKHPEKLIPGAQPISIPADDIDGLYSTQLSDGVLYYNATAHDIPVANLIVPAHGIAFQPASR